MIARWGIEPLFADFKSCGFGLEQSQLRTPERLARLLSVMSLALYFAVSTGRWDAATHPTVDEKTPATSTRKPEPQQTILVHHTRRAPHRQAFPVQPANPAILGLRKKLMDGEALMRSAQTIMPLDADA